MTQHAQMQHFVLIESFPAVLRHQRNPQKAFNKRLFSALELALNDLWIREIPYLQVCIWTLNLRGCIHTTKLSPEFSPDQQPQTHHSCSSELLVLGGYTHTAYCCSPHNVLPSPTKSLHTYLILIEINSSWSPSLSYQHWSNLSIVRK